MTFGDTIERSSQSTLPVHCSLANVPDDNHLLPESGPFLAKRELRIRTSEGSKATPCDPMCEAMKPLTDEERRAWKGWVELESDPVSIRAHSWSPPLTLSDHLTVKTRLVVVQKTVLTHSTGSLQLHVTGVWNQRCESAGGT